MGWFAHGREHRRSTSKKKDRKGGVLDELILPTGMALRLSSEPVFDANCGAFAPIARFMQTAARVSGQNATVGSGSVFKVRVEIAMHAINAVHPITPPPPSDRNSADGVYRGVITPAS